MKTIKMMAIGAILALTTISCSEQEINCDCDRVAQVNLFTINGGNYGNFVTVNDCTNLQQTWAINTYGVPNVGDCK